VSSLLPNSPSAPVVPEQVHRSANRALLGIVWLSSGIFGLYILANYASAWFEGDLERWNNVLPDIYQPGETAASLGIGIHFAAGGIILLLGGLQLIAGIRRNYPTFHRVTGRIYVSVSMLAAVGGLAFIALKGTVGGTVMDIGFGLYGLLMLLAAVQTIRFGMAKKFSHHQAWAWRLYALAIGSWLYRMDYGLWLALTDWVGHTDGFDGWFDRIMAFFFYMPNLVIVELMIRSRNKTASDTLRMASTVAVLAACGILLLATWTFTTLAWWPAIVDWVVS
jgi:hypothetical protein